MELNVKIPSKKLFSPTFIFLLLIMFLVEVVKSALLVTILPVYMGSVLQLTTFAIGLSISLQYIGDNLFRSPAGWLIERVGFRTTMLVGLIFTTAAVSLIAFGKNSALIILACALLGIGTAPLWPCVLMGATAITGGKNNFGTAMGVIQMATLGGSGTGPIVINFFIEGSYQPVFWILLCCMALTLFLAFLLPGRNKAGEVDPKVLHPNSDQSLMKGGLRRLGANLRRTLSDVRNNLNVSWLLYPALFLQSFAVGLLTPVITLYIRTELNLSPETYSAMLIVGGGITVLGLIPIGRLVDKYGTKWFLHIGFFMSAVTIGCFAMTRDITWVWGLVALIGVSYAFILPTWDTMISHQLPTGEKGTVWGLFLTIQGSGMVFGPMVSGKLWDVLGPSSPFLASAISMAVLFVIHIRLSRPRQNVRDQEMA
ncbi:MFS transporter [Paenibacillus sp. CAA11]|uniref:MFS transporter n=1 Tax=Paenibacillus sp. CAA11 TaxID=1532905 RepID=UPI000D36EC54|nr:MFS transporter [Paenibacillus sp. CAA11]AWB45205.1 MFS transporter [Paenibacillus sp. CAA11]